MNPLEKQPNIQPNPGANQDLRTSRKKWKQTDKVTEIKPSPLRVGQSSSIKPYEGFNAVIKSEPELVTIQEGYIAHQQPLKDSLLDIDDSHLMQHMSKETAVLYLKNRPIGDFVFVKQLDMTFYLVAKDKAGKIQQELITNPNDLLYQNCMKHCNEMYGGLNLIDRDILRYQMPFDSRDNSLTILADHPVGSFIIRRSRQLGAVSIDVKMNNTGDDEKDYESFRFIKTANAPKEQVPTYQWEGQGKEMTLLEIIDWMDKERHGHSLITPDSLFNKE